MRLDRLHLLIHYEDLRSVLWMEDGIVLMRVPRSALE